MKDMILAKVDVFFLRGEDSPIKQNIVPTHFWHIDYFGPLTTPHPCSTSLMLIPFQITELFLFNQPNLAILYVL